MIAVVKIWCLLIVFLLITNHEMEALTPGIIGNEANLEDYPFIVYLSVNYKLLGETFTDPCAGTYIKSSWVLTAGECIRNSSAFWSDYVELNSLECRMGVRQADAAHLQSYPAIKAKRLFVHPRFDRERLTVKGNVGLVLLEKPFDLSETVATIDLPTAAIDLTGKTVTTVGYSTIYQYVPTYQRVPDEYKKLRLLNAEVWYPTECRSNFRGVKGQVCIGEPAGHAWAFDLGGPLLLGKQLVGIVTVDVDKGLEFFGVYDELFQYKSWIESTIARILVGRKMSNSVRRARVAIPIVFLNLVLVYLFKFV